MFNIHHLFSKVLVDVNLHTFLPLVLFISFGVVLLLLYFIYMDFVFNKAFNVFTYALILYASLISVFCFLFLVEVQDLSQEKLVILKKLAEYIKYSAKQKELLKIANATINKQILLTYHTNVLFVLGVCTGVLLIILF